MKDVLITGCFIVAILLMAGPQACYNAGSWVGLIMKAFWKASVWFFRVVRNSMGKTEKPEAMAEVGVTAANVFALADAKTVNSPAAPSREGRTIEGVAQVL